MSLGTFCLVKNENNWIAPHIIRVLPYIDEMVFFDGNSTDGTLEIIKKIRDENENGRKIKLFEKKDPADFDKAYEGMFNECLHSLSTDLAFFLHPDMYVENPEQLLKIKDSDAIAMSTNIRSFGGEPYGKLFEITEGRGAKWKNIYRLRNPDLGAVYHGAYGAANEDVYHTEIVGDSRDFYGSQFHKYPYEVIDSGLKVLHFSDVRPYERRYTRMLRCLINQGMDPKAAETRSLLHPRVSLVEEPGFKLTESQYPPEFVEIRDKYGVINATA